MSLRRQNRKVPRTVIVVEREKSVTRLTKLITLIPAIASALAAIISAGTAIYALRFNAAQTQIAQQALIYANRPWLTVGTKLSSDIVPQSDGTLQVRFKTNSSNVGRSPALNVSSYLIYDYEDWNAYDAIKRWCNTDITFPLPHRAFHQQVVWPGGSLAEQETSFALKPTELSKVDNGANSKLLFVVQCVEYEVSGDLKVHHAAGAWRFLKLRESGPGNEGFPLNRSTPMSNLLLVRGWGGEAEYAD